MTAVVLIQRHTSVVRAELVEKKNCLFPPAFTQDEFTRFPFKDKNVEQTAKNLSSNQSKT